MEQEMKYIYTVYKHASFSKAASALFMTQPALSLAVQRVEAKVGMPLFDRTCKPLKLTAAGELYIRKYVEIENLENELEQQINDLSTLQAGTLRIGGSHYINSYVLPPVLAAFAREYPKVRLELTEAGSSDLLQMLYDHDIDITFNCTEKPNDSFRRAPCFIDMILLAVPADFPVNRRLADCAFTSDDILEKKHQLFGTPGVSMAEFADTPFILLTPGNNLYSRSSRFFEAAGVTPDIRLQVSQLVTAWHLSCAGMGAAFISDFLVTSRTDKVLFYKISSPGTIRVFDIAMSGRHYVSNAMKAFEELFREWYGMNIPDREPER